MAAKSRVTPSAECHGSHCPSTQAWSGSLPGTDQTENLALHPPLWTLDLYTIDFNSETQTSGKGGVEGIPRHLIDLEGISEDSIASFNSTHSQDTNPLFDLNQLRLFLASHTSKLGNIDLAYSYKSHMEHGGRVFLVWIQTR